MSVRVDAEEVEPTRGEKVLAVVLAVFVLIGGLWAYFKLDEVDRPTQIFQLQQRATSSAERAAVARHRAAERATRRAERAVGEDLGELELRREEFRTALEAGAPAGELRAAYLEAREDFAAGQRELERVEQRVAATADEARAAQEQIQAARREAIQRHRDEREAHDRLVAALRLVLVLGMLGGGYLLLGRARRLRSRYMPLTFAAVGAAAALALAMAVDYTTDVIDVEELGPLALSLAGSAMTVAAFAGLQRYLARRIPIRRVRRQQCPFCGFPVGDNARCEGCGRQVVGECAACQRPRRVGTEHCGACGSA